MRWAVVLATSFVLSSTAHAQNVEAETLFVDGEKLMAAGKYAEACDSFAASNRIEPRAGTLINLGMCQEKRAKLASAWGAFRDALTRVKDPVKKQFATDRAAAIEARMSSLTIEVKDPNIAGLVVLRDGQPIDRALFGRAIPIDGGTHRVEARAPGHTTWRSDVSVNDERDRSTVIVPLLEPAASGAPSLVPPTQAPRDEPSGPNSHRNMAIAFGAVAGVGLAVGIWGGVTARGFDRDATALCPDLDAQCADAAAANDLLDKRDTRALIANIGFGVAAAGAIAAVIAIVTGDSEPAAANVAVISREGGALVQWKVGF